MHGLFILSLRPQKRAPTIWTFQCHPLGLMRRMLPLDNLFPLRVHKETRQFHDKFHGGVHFLQMKHRKIVFCLTCPCCIDQR